MWLLIAFLAVGFGEAVGQVVLIRELIVNFQGNELSLGIILACWLLMMGLGSWLLGRIARRFSAEPSTFVITILIYAILLPCQVFLARGVNSLIGVEAGEIAGLGSILLASLIVLTPLCLLHGLQFPYACRILSAQRGVASFQVGRVYVAEAIGTMVGGILITYLLVHYLNHLEIAALTVFLNLAAGLLLLRPLSSVRFLLRKVAVGILCLLAISLMATGSLGRLDFLSSQWQWQGHDLVSVENSVYQNIAVTRRGDQFNFFANGMLVFTAPVPDITSIEELAHLPLLHHPAPRNVLVVGGGMGGLLEEVVRHPVQSVVYIEPDPRMIGMATAHLPWNPLEDARISVEYTDGRFFIERTDRRFDVVLMNLPPPSTLQVNRFYTVEFFEAVRGILEDDGIFAFGMLSSDAYLSEEMLTLNRALYSTLTEVFPEVLVIPNGLSVLVASSEPSLHQLDSSEIAARLQERELETRLLTTHYIEYKLSPERISRLAGYLDEPGEINRDRRPVSTFHSLALWNAMFYPQLKGVLSLMMTVQMWWFLPPLLLLVLPAVRAATRRQTTLYPVGLGLFSTGFAGMTCSMVLLFAFQVSHGHLYQKIGILLAAFMLGAALGGWMMNRSMDRVSGDLQLYRRIVLAVAVYAGLLPWLILLSEGLSSVPGELPYSLLNLTAGLLTGLLFPLAGRICLKEEAGVAPVVGLIYAADLWGAVLGALLASVFLIPILGVSQTCILAGLVSIVSYGVLIFSSRVPR